MSEKDIRQLEREIADAGQRINADLRASMQNFIDVMQARIRADREVQELQRIWHHQPAPPGM